MRGIPGGPGCQWVKQEVFSVQGGWGSTPGTLKVLHLPQSLSVGISNQELEWDPEIRVAPVEENSVLDTSLNEVFFVLH